MLKRVLKSAAAARIASVGIGAYIRLTTATTRWRIVNREFFDEAEAKGNGVIVAFWHGRLMLSPQLCNETEKPVYMLISAHRDGEIIANAVRSYNIHFIRGSAANPKKPRQNKHGASAVAQIVAALEDGGIVGVTPDGPRGPCAKVQAGLVKLAQLSGAPIIPAGMSVNTGPRLSTWDRFLVPFPFSRGFYVAGPAFTIAKDADAATVEAMRQAIEKAIFDATTEADRLAGREWAQSVDPNLASVS